MNGGRVITGRMVLFGVLAFFGVVFAANGALVFFALDTFPGLAADHAYDAGLAYNRVLETARQQQMRGWVSAISLEGGGRDVVVRIAAREGAPVTGLAARVTFRRPLGAAHRHTVALAEKSPGTYVGAAALPLAGRWYGIVEASQGGEAVFRMDHEILVKQ